MKSIVNSTGLLSKRPFMLVSFIVIMISCSKSDNTTSNATNSNGANAYCKTVSWEDTNGRTGVFTGTITNNRYNLTSVSYSENPNRTGYVSFSYDASGNLMNQKGFTVTYNQGRLVKYVVDLSLVSKATGTATYTFDSNGYLTNISDVGSDENGPLSLSITYTYDDNGDPVHIVGHGTQTLSQGPGTVDYDITADYLTDKPQLLPFNPIAAPFAVYFAYQPFLSKHLVNKWVLKQNTIVVGYVIPSVNFTYQYNYTYDADGRVATMYHSGNPNNIYTFTYSGCN